MRKKKKPVAQQSLVLPPQPGLPAVDFVKVEKNLNSLGFFTPSSKNIRDTKAKTIIFTRTVDGKKVEAKVTIAPAALYGLPVTADQDKYLAFQKIITDIRQEKGLVTNPVGFTSADILRLLGKEDAGKNYHEIKEWLKRMTATTIVSEGAVYLAGRRVWAQDSFHVFDRAVALGQKFPDGSVADRNYVWLSDWQLENINNNHLLPIDFEAYKKLKSHIAKALVPMLQVWLFASTEKGSFEKRYDELCQCLNIKEYKHLSKITEKLGPALDELKAHGYIQRWKVELTSDRKTFKVVFYHGEKFHRDRRQRLGQGESGEVVESQGTQEELLSEVQQGWVKSLLEKGVLENAARELIYALPLEQQVADQLEWIDELLKKEGDKIKNPAGLTIHLLKGNVAVPADFTTSRKRAQMQAARAEAEEAHRRQFEIEAAYEKYQEAEYQKYLSDQVDPAEYTRLLEEEQQRLKRLLKGDFFKDSLWTEQGHYDRMAKSAVKRQLIDQVNFMDFSDFSRRYQTEPDFAVQYRPVSENQT